MKKALSLALALMMLMSLCITPVLAAEPQGSQSNPYYVAKPDSIPNLITVPANGTVYYQYKANVFNGWSVSAYGLSAITVDGTVYDTPTLQGELTAPFNFRVISPGIVGYVNNTDEEIEVALTHNEPIGTERNPDTFVDGDNVLSIPAGISSYVADYMPTASGEYTFTCEQYENVTVSVEIDGTSYALENGSLTLELVSYIFVRFYISNHGVTPDVTVSIAPPKAGTESNPIWLGVDQMDAAYALVDTEPLYFSVDGSLTGNTLLIESKNGINLAVELDGEVYTAENGVLYLPLDTADWMMSLVISQAEATDNELYFSVEYGEGSYENPIELVDGENAISIPEKGNYYYTYTAQSEGLLVITPADASQFGLLDISYEDDEFNYHYGYLAVGASSVMMPVPAGQTVIISACGVWDEEIFDNRAVDTVLNVSMKDLLLYNTFEGVDLVGSLEGWSSDSDLVLEEIDVANGFYSAAFHATNDWANMYNYINVEPNTDYEVTLKAKGAIESTLWVKFNDNWVADVGQADLAITTEWQEYTVSINSGNCTNLVLLLQHAGLATDGQTIWLDDIVIIKVESEGPVVPDYVPGDMTGDGKVNNKDLGRLQQHLNDWADVELNLNAADVTGDGKVNNKDMGRLQQYLNDWDVELQYGAIAE